MKNVEHPRILHVFDGFRVGGTELRTCNIINFLDKGFRHVIISNNGNFDAASLIKTDTDIDYIHPDTSRAPFPLSIARICRMLRSINADLMIAYEWGAIDWVLANCMARSRPMIMTVEGFEDSELFVQKRKRLMVRRLLYQRCDRVVVCSRTLYRIAMDEWKLRPPRLLYIPNGVDCSRFTPSARVRNQRREVRLGIIASLIKLKNHIKLLRCLKEVSDGLPFSLHVAGDGPELDNLRRFCRESGLADRVHFLGHVQDTEEFLKQIDIFCLSSITEQMPMVVLEAMATGLPVVSTDVGDVKLMVSEENRPFIVDSNDDGLYVRALKELIGSGPLRKDLGSANRQRCLELYDEQLMFKRYKDLYQSCVCIDS